MMFLRLLLLFTLVPLVELYVLIVLGRRFGLLPTVALVFTTGLLGAWLARRQGLDTWRRLQSEMAAGRLPGAAMVDGLLILIAGAVLLTPGLLTDLFGFFLLMPAGRELVRTLLISRFERSLRQGRGQVIIVDHQGPPRPR